uniref:VCBS n=1 Tax=Chlorobium chlorochromatii (strain CaD3) TaxID=340177 RepID=Q3AQB0_CHLCH
MRCHLQSIKKFPTLTLYNLHAFFHINFLTIMAINTPSSLVRRELFIFDASVSNVATLASALPANSDYFVLDSTRDGLGQMADVLAGQTDIDALHIFSHGSAGLLRLGNSSLSLANLNNYELPLSQIGSSLSPSSDILLYGCNVGAGDDGQQFVATLAELTGADVAASADVTGSAALGGDWELEVESGVVENEPMAVAGFEGVLANSIPTISAPLATTVAAGDSPVSLNLLANAHDDDLTDTLSVGNVSYTVNGVPSALPAGITMNGNALTIDSANTAYNGMAQGEQKTIVVTYKLLDSYANAEISFATKVDYAVGSGPVGTTSADVNGDGELDLIVANFQSDTVSVLKNNGDGIFATKVDYPTGSCPQSVTSSDVNGDGKLDLIATNWGSDTVSVLENNGEGTFATKVDYATGYSPWPVTSADVNGDGKFDLIVANFYSNTVSVLKNNGDGTFVTKVDYPTGLSPLSVTSADVNGDSELDLIVANMYSDTISVLNNNGDGTFATQVDYPTGSFPYSVTSSDVNGDGKLDLIVVNYYSNTVSVLNNNGDGTFATQVDYPTGTWPSSVTSADVNGDGKLDLIVANAQSMVSVLKNNGDGTFATKVDYPTGLSPYSVTSSDVNGDGKPDLIIANRDSATVSVLINNSTGFSSVYPTTTATITITGANDAPIVDVTDVIGTVTKPVPPIGNLTDSGTIHFTDVDLSDSHSISSVTPSAGVLGTLTSTITADTTGTGLGGAITWHYSVAASAVEYLAEGEHKVETFTFSLLDGHGGSVERTVGVTITSPNADTILPTLSNSTPADAATAVAVDSNITLTFSENVQASTGNIVITNGSDTRTIDVTDNTQVTFSGNTVTINPTADLQAGHHYHVEMANGAITDEAGNAFAGISDVTALDFTTKGNVAPHIFAPVSLSFADKIDYVTGAQPNSVTAADINSDGNVDLIVANWGGNTVSVLNNNGDGTFANKVDYTTGSGVISVTNADVDGDGSVDLIFANSISNTISVLKNNGDGIFSPKVDYSVGKNPWSIISTDIDNDGMPDLIVGTNGHDMPWDMGLAQICNAISVFKNNGDGSFASKVDYAIENAFFSVASADVNGDGQTDLIGANWTTGGLSILQNNGDGSFASKVDYAIPNSFYSVASTDLNSDGKPDIFGSNLAVNGVSILQNNGDGTFASKVDYATGSNPWIVNSCDINGDGFSDISVVNTGSNTVSVLINKGDGTFLDKKDYSTGNMPFGLSSADLNKDGKSDLIVVNSSDSNTVSVFLNSTSSVLTHFTEQTPVAVCSDISSSDPDGDASWNGGALTIQVTANAEATDTLSIATTNPGGNGVWLDTTIGYKLMAGTTEIGSANAALVSNGSTLSFSFNANSTNAMVQDVARSVTFNNSSDTPSELERTVTFTVTDNFGASASVEQIITVTAVNDPIDSISPVLTSSTPSDNTTGVAVSSNITLTFSENVHAGTGNITITDGTDTHTIAVANTTQITFNGKTVIINPTKNLQEGHHYHVEVANGAIKDLAGNAFAGINDATTLNFTTVKSDSDHHDLTGTITFWKTGQALSDVHVNLMPTASTGTAHLIDFRNIELHADGSRTVEIWKTATPTEAENVDFELELQAGSTATWQSMLPNGWLSADGADGNLFSVQAAGLNAPLSANAVQLGVLTLTQPTDTQTFSLSLVDGIVGTQEATPFTLHSEQTISDAAGNYFFTNLQESNYTISANKEYNTLHNAVTSADALAALKIAVGLTPNEDGSAILPYQYLAADVTHDGRVRSTDALTILKMAVGYEGAPENAWIFVAEEDVLATSMSRKAVDWSIEKIDVPLENDTQVDLIGIVKGDIDGSWGMVG